METERSAGMERKEVMERRESMERDGRNATTESGEELRRITGMYALMQKERSPRRC